MTPALFTCFLEYLQTDQSPNQNTRESAVFFYNKTVMTKLIPPFQNSRIATAKKWVGEGRRDGSCSGRLFAKFSYFSYFHFDSLNNEKV